MLVTFSCPAFADITTFGTVAVRLLQIMGHGGTVPGAFMAAEVPAALQRLEAGVAAVEESPAPPESSAEEDEEPPVSLRHRALPFIQLFKAAAKDECNVMWKSNQ